MRIYRYVRVKKDGPPAGGNPAAPGQQSQTVVFGVKEYVERLMLLIPAEVTVVYPLLRSVLKPLPKESVAITLSGVIAVLITLLLRTKGLPDSSKPQPAAVVISLIACLIWIYQQGGYVFFAITPGWEPLATAAAIVFPILAPFCVKGEDKIV